MDQALIPISTIQKFPALAIIFFSSETYFKYLKTRFFHSLARYIGIYIMAKRLDQIGHDAVFQAEGTNISQNDNVFTIYSACNVHGICWNLSRIYILKKWNLYLVIFFVVSFGRGTMHIICNCLSLQLELTHNLLIFIFSIALKFYCKINIKQIMFLS